MIQRLIVLILLCCLGLACHHPTNNEPYLSPFSQVDKQDIHLYLLVGQSNMAGRAEPEAIDKEPHPRVFHLNADMQWQSAIEPLHFDKPRVVGTGPGLAFGKAMAAAYPDKMIGLIPVAVGGSSISFWEPGVLHPQTDLYPFDRAIRWLDKASEEGQLKGIIWHQGESDSYPQKFPMYQDRLANLISRFRSHTAQDSLPFILGELSQRFVEDRLPQDSSAWYINQQVLPTLRDEMPKVGLISSQGADMIPSDPIHFSAEASRLLGSRYAEEMIRLLQD